MRKRCTARSWRVDEIHLKVRGKWTYLYRAVHHDDQTLDFMLSERGDLDAARRFFKKAIATNGVPERAFIDKSGANLAGLQAGDATHSKTSMPGASKHRRSQIDCVISNEVLQVLSECAC